MEVGIGGSLEEKNVIKENEVQIIMKVQIDNKEYIGDKEEMIEEEKEGIIKKK